MAGQNEVKAGEEKTMATQVGHWCEYRMEKQEAFICYLLSQTQSTLVQTWSGQVTTSQQLCSMSDSGLNTAPNKKPVPESIDWKSQKGPQH